jgi:hypothetical protein
MLAVRMVSTTSSEGLDRKPSDVTDLQNKNQMPEFRLPHQKVMMKIPEERPSLAMAFILGPLGLAHSWDVWAAEDEDDFKRLKDQFVTEATAVGVLAALILTISAQVIVNDPPESFLGDQGNNSTDFKVSQTADSLLGGDPNIYYLLWFISTIFLAFSTLLSVIQSIEFAQLKGQEVKYFGLGLGILLHVPLILFVVGAIFAIISLGYTFFFIVSLKIWIAGLVITLFMLIIISIVSSYMILVKYDAKKHAQDDSDAWTARIPSDSDPKTQPSIKKESDRDSEISTVGKESRPDSIMPVFEDSEALTSQYPIQDMGRN